MSALQKGNIELSHLKDVKNLEFANLGSTVAENSTLKQLVEEMQRKFDETEVANKKLEEANSKLTSENRQI